jgi:hypothetical protein
VKRRKLGVIVLRDRGEKEKKKKDGCDDWTHWKLTKPLRMSWP